MYFKELRQILDGKSRHRQDAGFQNVQFGESGFPQISAKFARVSAP